MTLPVTATPFLTIVALRTRGEPHNTLTFDTFIISPFYLFSYFLKYEWPLPVQAAVGLAGRRCA
jgi:hypothetical protein